MELEHAHYGAVPQRVAVVANNHVMTLEHIDARSHLEGLVGRTIHTFRGEPNVVRRVTSETVEVGTGRSPAGEPVPIEWVQDGIDRLLREGEVSIGVDALGYRSAFVAAVLLTLPGAERASDPARVVLARGRSWDLEPGETIRRRELHDRFGGSRQGGISPSRTTPNIFIFSDPAVGEEHGYLDHWEEGVFHYAGEGQYGDQTLTRGNRALLDHRREGRAPRVFWGAGGDVEYAGEFTLDYHEPTYVAKAPETGGGPLRQVIMFKLLPVSVAVAVPATQRRAAQTTRPSFETSYRDADETTKSAPRDPFEVDPDKIDRGLRSHAAIQNTLAERVREDGLRPLSPGPGDPDFDLAWEDQGELVLVEVKSITAGNEAKQLRLGLGQVLDYADQASAVNRRVRAALAIEAPPAAERWVALCKRHGVELVWPATFSSLVGPGGRAGRPGM